MAFTRVFQDFNRTWLQIGDGAGDIFTGDGTVPSGPHKGSFQTRDEIRAGGGDDFLDGERGRNLLFAEAGDDRITLGDVGDGLAWDRAYGGAGSDIFYGSTTRPIDGKVHLANGGAGADSFWFHLTPDAADLRGDTVFVDGIAAVKLKSIETVIGSAHDDVLRAGGATFELIGGSGDDRLVANPLENPGHPDRGSTLVGGVGADVLRGGGYRDVLFDHFDPRTGPPASTDADLDRLYGGGGADLLFSFSGDDKLVGGAGRDIIRSLSGNDIIHGGDGADTILFGAPGHWSLDITRTQGSLYGVSIDGGTDGRGGDTVDFSMVTLSTGALLRGLEINLGVGKGWNLASPDGPQKFRIREIEHVAGTERSDVLTGSAEGNTLLGLGGEDIIRGGAGRDQLDGGAGSDRLFGGANRDLLYSDFDGDILQGGSGIDRFDFTRTDFTRSGLTARIVDYDLREAVLTDWEGLFHLDIKDTTEGALVTGDGGVTNILFEGIRAADLALDRFFFHPPSEDDF
ncbi:calcium-binding protein [Pseudodonghicola flavimaris]|uniref:Calcium-binding protein n=1 Tax=Pseudodonghicola flavimaris TaxID=3050036 RepID=A0ABT7F4C8_9RHOB|nr:calcium-binding protein [Pseudodonghicola flavimaris]MDK3019462.1 calcium-binding protein [Pseudodonghicola flavimaris]